MTRKMEDLKTLNGVPAVKGFSEQEETSGLATTAQLGQSRWTDEKHNSFLNSVEATFVERLHKSLDSKGWQMHKNPQPDSSSDQHTTKVSRHGTCSRIYSKILEYNDDNVPEMTGQNFQP